MGFIWTWLLLHAALVIQGAEMMKVGFGSFSGEKIQSY